MLRNTGRRNTPEAELDLYFLIAQFLSQGPCQDAAKTLISELEKNGLLHKNLDWTGIVQQPTFEHSVSSFRDVSPDFLLQMCQRMGSLFLSNLPGPSKMETSLCSIGKRYLHQQNTREKTVQWSAKTYGACILGRPVMPPHNFTTSYSLLKPILSREIGGSKYKNLLRPVNALYSRMKLHRRVLGHLSSVYCILFDRTGQRIFTGSDDCLIKCWDTSNGRLLSTFRGHQSEICDMDISFENTILASASCDKEIRIWDTRNGNPITILQSHSAMITSIEFSALVQGDTRYLISTGRDGNVCFWMWNARTLQFFAQPNKFQERNRPGVAMLCSSCSAGGRFIAVGGSDNLVHIYQIPFEHGVTTIGPIVVAEQDEHTNTVDSIWFSHSGLRLISGSKDGTARVWTFEYSTWVSLVLDVTRSFDSSLDPLPEDLTNSQPSTSKSSSKTQAANSSNKLCVIMVAWDCNDENVMTSLTDFSIKVWDSRSRRLVSILKGHKDEAYCLEPHPNDKRIFLSAGHDGNVFLWDVTNGGVIMNFHNMLEGLGHGAVFDAKFSRDGSSFACTDSHGHLLLFGYGDGKAYHKSPIQQFFHTDYRPLIRDQQGYVLDEQTQQAPHLMPPPFLVDVDGNPYPAEMQRLVPGREHLNPQQQQPSFIMEENGVHFVDVESVPLDEDPAPRSILDNIIAQMQQQEGEGEVVAPADDPQPFMSPVGLRREGDLAGVRQMHRNAPRSQLASVADIAALTQRVLTPQYSQEEINFFSSQRKKKGLYEINWHRKETHKRRSTTYRRQSRDFTKQSSSASKNREVTTRSLRRHTRRHYKDDDEEVTEENSISRRRRLLAPIHTNEHGYSTRSRAPRRRMSSVAESVQENGEIDIETIDENILSSETGETSAFTSSDEDFSQKVKIIRRSKRKKNSHADRHDDKCSHDEIEVNGLRRSSRHRRVPKRLKNTSSDEEKSSAHSDGNDTQENSASTSSFQSPIGVRRSKRKKRGENRKKRTRSTKPDHLESSEEEQITEVVDGDIKPSTSKSQENNDVQLDVKSTSSAKSLNKTTKRELITLPFEVVAGQGPPAMYLPPDWVTRVTPCHFPYIPQIEDEIIYIREGHVLYINKVISEKIWNVNEEELCYRLDPNISNSEACRVIEIKYHVGPPTLCEVFLRPINRKFFKKSLPFSVKFHDMPNVVDFLILKDKFDTSMKRKWKISDRFRSIIDDSWWYGTIVAFREEISENSDSKFQSFSVLWDSDSQEDLDYLSPWDMEPVPANVINTVRTRSHDNTPSSSSTQTEHIPVGTKELHEVISYKLKPSDWGFDMDTNDGSEADDYLNTYSKQECDRIADGIQQLLREEEYGSFASPVDTRSYPGYPLYVAFPTDLHTMFQRLRNNFYRRLAALQWEISCLEKNARAFNEPESAIVERATMLCQILNEFILNKNCTDIEELVHNVDVKSSSSEEENSEVCALSEVDSQGNGTLSSESDDDPAENHQRDSQSISEYTTTAGEDEETNVKWIEDCKKLLNEVLVAQDSRPFRSIPKDDEDVEDEDVLDLNMIKNKLLSSEYKDPKALREDVLLMFTTYKNSNPEREGRSMMARLSPLMTARIDNVISEWKKAQTKHKNEKKTVSLRRSTRNRRSQNYYDSRSQSSKHSQDSDWLSEPQPRRSTRQTLRSYAEVIVNGSGQNCRRSERQFHRKARSMRLKTVDSDENEVNFVSSEKLVESGDRTTRKRTLKRAPSSDVDEIGQGDAPVALRRRKKPRLNFRERISSSDDNEGAINNNHDSDSSYDVPKNFQKTKKKIKTNGHAKIGEEEKGFKYVSEDSDQDCYGSFVETDDLEGEAPALSPDGRVLRRKKTGMRNGYSDHEQPRSPTFCKTEHR